MSGLLPAVMLHNWANAQRPLGGRAVVRVGSLRWWLPWPRRAAFPDVRSWKAARAAQVTLYVWSGGMLVMAIVEFAGLRSLWRAG